MRTEQEIKKQLEYYLDYVSGEPIDIDVTRTKITMLRWVLNEK